MSEFDRGSFSDVSKEAQIDRLHRAVFFMASRVGVSSSIDIILNGGEMLLDEAEPQTETEHPELATDDPADPAPTPTVVTKQGDEIREEQAPAEEEAEQETSVETEDATAAPV